MPFCFICNAKLYRVRTQVCSSITPHTNTPYPEKIAGMMGEEFVVVVTPNDQMCMKCTLHLNHLDKCHNDAKIIINAMLTMMNAKYGLLAAEGDKIVNGHVMAKEKLEQGQRKVPGDLTEKVSPTATATATTATATTATDTTATVVTPVKTPLQLLKTQQQQQQPQQESANKIKIYKCGFCTFQSKEQDNFRFHMLTHKNKNEPKNPILNQAAAKTLTPEQQQKKQFYRCQVYAKTFDSQINCLDHIQQNHDQPTASTSIGERETEDSRPITTKVLKFKPSKIQENNQQAETHMGVDKNQQDNNKDTEDMDMMLNDNTSTEEYAGIEEEKEMENAVKERKSKTLRNIQLRKKPNQRKNKPEPAQEEVAELEEDTAMPEQEEAD